ncbi:MAG: transposase [Proteobacteria bacterium]|nr:transposase [Pseudomonadota bacterium]
MESNDKGIENFATELRKKLDEHFASLPKPVLRNIVEIVIALVILLRTPRGWYGRMTFQGIARCMRTEGDVRVRSKRLDRFLRNKRFETSEIIFGMLSLTRGEDSKGLLPILIDQSAVGDVQVIAASFPYQGRAIPLSVETFEYEKMELSQNQIEQGFFAELQKSVGKGIRPLFTMDRGYANVKYILKFNRQKALYIIRGCSNVKIEYNNGGKFRRIGLGRLPHRQGQARRYRNVIYHDKEKALVDIVVYREKGFKESWFLIVPPGVEEILPTEQVVEWYRSRMRIEVKFRDFKSCLGVRGLKLKVDKAEKIGRLLICMAIAYVLLIVMGDSDLGRQLRKRIEVLRKRRRHGTRRTLSVLSIALFMATDSFLLTLSNLMGLLASILSLSTGALCPAT